MKIIRIINLTMGTIGMAAMLYAIHLFGIQPRHYLVIPLYALMIFSGLFGNKIQRWLES